MMRVNIVAFSEDLAPCQRGKAGCHQNHGACPKPGVSHPNLESLTLHSYLPGLVKTANWLHHDHLYIVRLHAQTGKLLVVNITTNGEVKVSPENTALLAADPRATR